MEDPGADEGQDLFMADAGRQDPDARSTISKRMHRLAGLPTVSLTEHGNYGSHNVGLCLRNKLLERDHNPLQPALYEQKYLRCLVTGTTVLGTTGKKVWNTA